MTWTDIGEICITLQFQILDDMYRLGTSKWVSIKHTIVVVAVLLSTSEGAGSIPTGATNFSAAQHSKDTMIGSQIIIPRLHNISKNNISAKNSNTASKNILQVTGLYLRLRFVLKWYFNFHIVIFHLK